MILLQMNLAVVEGIVVVVVVEGLVGCGADVEGLGVSFLQVILSFVKRSRDLGMIVE